MIPNRRQASGRQGRREHSWPVGTAVLWFLCAVVLAWGSSGRAETPAMRVPSPDRNSDPSPKLPETDEPLTQRLDRSDGVIRPPDHIDPEISVPPKDPNAGANMPVIPPPKPNAPGSGETPK